MSAYLSIRHVLLLAMMTWKEGVRRRVLVVGFLLTLAFVALYGVGAYFSFRNWQPGAHLPSGASTGSVDVSGAADLIRNVAAFQMLSFGMFVASFLGAMLVVFLASGMISGDAENGTLQTLVTRPIGRPQILFGRFLGYGTIFACYLLLLSAGLIVLTRVFAGYLPPSPGSAMTLLVLQGLILLGLVTIGTAVLPPAATGIAVFMAFGVAFIGGVVEQIGGLLQNGTAESIGSAVHYLIPTDAFFRMALHGLQPSLFPLFAQSGATGPFGTLIPRPGIILYGLAYLVFSLVLSMRLFQRKDL